MDAVQTALPSPRGAGSPARDNAAGSFVRDDAGARDNAEGSSARENEYPPLLIEIPDAAPVDLGLQNNVRLAIATAAEGRSYHSYARDAARAERAGAKLSGPRNRDFAAEVAALAAAVLSQLDAQDFTAVVPGLGIPSDFAILADPVAMGEGTVARHGHLLAICLAIVSPVTGRVYSPMFDAPLMGIGGHRGPDIVETILETFSKHPVHWTLKSLGQRCASVGGDGALSCGGPEARHQSTGAAEMLWKRIHPHVFPSQQAQPRPDGTSGDDSLASLTAPAKRPNLHRVTPDDSLSLASLASLAALPNRPVCTVWDPFHRADVALWRSINKNESAQKVFDMSREVDHMFAQSEGKLIFQRAGSQVDSDDAARDNNWTQAHPLPGPRRPGRGCLRAPGATQKVV